MAVVCYYLLISLVVLQNHHLVESAAAITPEEEKEKAALYTLFKNTKHKTEVNWTLSTPNACNWLGVTCDYTNRVKSLNLPGKSFIGRIDNNTIGALTNLRVLSLPHNALSGTLPSDLSKLTLLRTLNLRNNKFIGKFPIVITRLKLLKYVDLAINNFMGQIPCRIQNMPILLELRLENNQFTGILPGLHLRKSVNFSVANNNISGAVPTTLSMLPLEAFDGNPLLCGVPLSSLCIYEATNQSYFSIREYCPSLTPQPNPAVTTFAMSGGGALFLLLFLIILLFPVRRKQRPTTNSNDTIQVKSQSKTSSFQHRRKLYIFPPEDNEQSTSTDSSWANGIDATEIMSGGAVLMQPALAKGMIGTTTSSYKVELMAVTDKVLVVKHLMDPEAVVSDELDFVNKMKFLGKIRHGNVMPLRGYCICEEEYLLIYDFIPGGSLYDCLHGSDRMGLDWESRKRIALGAAKGLAHLHKEVNLVHGNIKSSNILLHGENPAALDAYVADFGLTATPPASYYGQSETTTTTTVATNIKADVYAFGVLLLELLTGKSPDVDTNLVQGIQSSAAAAAEGGEIWDSKMRRPFDEKKMMGMICLLQIAKQCTHESADERPEMEKVARMIEDEIGYGSAGPVEEVSHEVCEVSLLHPGTPPPAFTP